MTIDLKWFIILVCCGCRVDQPGFRSGLFVFFWHFYRLVRRMGYVHTRYQVERKDREVTLTTMGIIRGALFNAFASGLTLEEVTAMAYNADTPDDFDRAVNMLAMATPQEERQ